MLHQRGSFLVEAASDAEARNGTTYSVFEAKPILMQGNGPTVTGNANPRKFDVVNTLDISVREGDILSVIKSAQGYWKTVKTGGEASGSMIRFELDELYPYGEESDACVDQDSEVSSIQRGRVVNRPCGSTRVFGEDEDGYVELQDPEGFLEGRSAIDISGKTGFATLLQDDYSCFWAITWISFWRERQVLTDWIVAGNTIRVEREIFKVWDHCTIEPEVIEGTDCEEEQYYDGGGV